MIGLTGTHRTGKTTLAKAWAEKNDVEYLPLNVADVIQEETGVDCANLTSMDLRLKAQRKLVEACDRTFLRRKTLFISDRTPLDVAAYTLGAVAMDMTPAQAQEVMQIVTDCIDITNSSFQSLVLVQPGIPYVSEPGKPPMNVAYQDLIHTLIVGLLKDGRLNVEQWRMPRRNVDIETRLSGLDSVHDGLTDTATYESESASVN